MLDRLDSASRVFLYILIFWLPYSPAVIESCVGFLLIFIILKKIIMFFSGDRKAGKNKSVATNLFLSSIGFPIVLFLMFSFISAYLSPLQSKSVYGVISKTLEWFIIFYCVIDIVKTKKQIYLIFGIMLFTSFAVALDSIFQIFLWKKDLFFGQELIEGRATAAFQHPNSLGAYMAVIVPLCIPLFGVPSINKRLKMSLSFIMVIFLISLAVSLSRGAWFSSLVGVISGIYLSGSRIFKYYFLVLVIAFTIVYNISAGTLIVPRLSETNVANSALWRFGVWEDTFKMIKARPLFGHGPNTFATVFQEYRRKKEGRHPYNPTSAHNCYLQLLAEGGVIGLASFCWILINIYRKLFAHLKTMEKQLRLEDIVFLGFLSGSITFLIHSLFDTNFYSLQLSALIWVMFGLLIAMVNIQKINGIIYSTGKQ